MRFGLGVPTGTEGMIYPVPYADPAQAARSGCGAPVQLGFDSVAVGNDHISTQGLCTGGVRGAAPVLRSLPVPGDYVVARTTTIRLATAITVMTFRHPVVLAKQAMTLDQLSGGRFMLGVGIGAYREETEERCGPAARCTGGTTPPSSWQACSVLFRERRASFPG